jgi:hypothetical protein
MKASMGLTVTGASTGVTINNTLTLSTYTRTAVTGLADVAEATIRAGEVTMSPFDGLLTVTSANADRAHRIAVAVSMSRAHFEKDVLPVKELAGLANMMELRATSWMRELSERVPAQSPDD